MSTSDGERVDGGGHALLEVEDLVQYFAARGEAGLSEGVVQAVSNVSFEIRAGETLGLVGETGSGKTTLARSIMMKPPPKSGRVLLRGMDLTQAKGTQLRELRREVQMVFQDPFQSLDPKWTVEGLVAEPLLAYRIGNKRERKRRVGEALDRVGLDVSVHGRRRPRELSGGQCQRVAIARALILSPALIVCDEAVSSLDVLIQAQVLNLFEQLRTELQLSYLFIAHDLAVVKHVSDRVAVMYLGRLAEIAPAERLYREPLHPYTAALLASIPSSHGRARTGPMNGAIEGEPPSPVYPPSGCRFRTRCPFAQERCAAEEPPMRELTSGHFVACHFPLVRDAAKVGEPV